MPTKKTTTKVKMFISVEPELKKRCETEAVKMGLTASGFVNVCITDYIKQRDAMDMLEVIGGIDNLRKLMQDKLS